MAFRLVGPAVVVAIVAVSGCRDDGPEVYEVDAPQVVEGRDVAGVSPIEGGGDAASVVALSTSGRAAQVAVQLNTCARPSAENWTARISASDEAVKVVMVPPAHLREEPLACGGSLMESIHEVRFRDAVGARTVEASIG